MSNDSRKADVITPKDSAHEAEFYDLRRLFRLRETLEKLRPDSPPRVLSLDPPNLDLRRIGILPGSFNPPTLAHVELAGQAKKSFQLDQVFFTISRVTIDKEKVQGLSLEDRLLLLSLIIQGWPWASIAAVNHGLYFEQAVALRSLLGNKPRIYFIVGMDKVVQIFSHHYYQDREEALKKLFAETQLIAASRGQWRRKDLDLLLDEAENQPYKDRIYFMSLKDELKELSSSAFREKIAAGEPVRGLLPEVVEKFISGTDAYRPGYEMRSSLLTRLYAVREWAEREVDFKKFFKLASAEGERRARLRELLSAPDCSPARLKDFILTFK